MPAQRHPLRAVRPGPLRLPGHGRVPGPDRHRLHEPEPRHRAQDHPVRPRPRSAARQDPPSPGRLIGATATWTPRARSPVPGDPTGAAGVPAIPGSVRDVACEFVEPGAGGGVAGGTPVTARRQRSSRADFRGVGRRGSLELAGLHETPQEQCQPCLDGRQVVLVALAFRHRLPPPPKRPVPRLDVLAGDVLDGLAFRRWVADVAEHLPGGGVDVDLRRVAPRAVMSWRAWLSIASLVANPGIVQARTLRRGRPSWSMPSTAMTRAWAESRPPFPAHPRCFAPAGPCGPPPMGRAPRGRSAHPPAPP